jgi:hypothetical protein
MGKQWKDAAFAQALEKVERKELASIDLLSNDKDFGHPRRLLPSHRA